MDRRREVGRNISLHWEGAEKWNASNQSAERIVIDSGISHFSVQISDDMRITEIGAILVLPYQTIVSDTPNAFLKLFDIHGAYLSSSH